MGVVLGGLYYYGGFIIWPGGGGGSAFETSNGQSAIYSTGGSGKGNGGNGGVHPIQGVSQVEAGEEKILIIQAHQLVALTVR